MPPFYFYIAYRFIKRICQVRLSKLEKVDPFVLRIVNII